MALSLHNLNPSVRTLMLNEFNLDLEPRRIYESPRLTPIGREHWDYLLKNAIESGDDNTLAYELLRGHYLRDSEIKHSSRGKPYTANINKPAAAEMLAEGEFNRYYIRAVALLAINSNVTSLEIYRAKPVNQPRPESLRRTGHLVNAQSLLTDLRKNIGVDTALGVPAGPNSGLSVRIPSVVNTKIG